MKYIHNSLIKNTFEKNEWKLGLKCQAIISEYDDSVSLKACEDLNFRWIFSSAISL